MVYQTSTLRSVISTIKIVVLFTVMAAIPIKQAAATPQYHSLSGVACQPANLGQAINLNASWNQTRAFNPNPISSGVSFFLTCPVQYSAAPFTGGEQLIGAHDVLVFVRRPTGADQVTCSVRRFDQVALGIGFNVVKTVTATTPLASIGEGIQLTLNDIVDSANQMQGDADYFVVLCALPPQTGINSIIFDYD